MSKIILDPVTRVEGHLRIDTEVQNGRISKAWSKGEMFRGIEAILIGRDPMDAPTITQRICGVCPVSHGIAATKALESALGITPTNNGRLLRNLILGANYLQNHILHFYQFSALDFLNIDIILDYNGKDTDLLALKDWASKELASNRILPAAPFLPQLKSAQGKAGDWAYLALDHYLEAFTVRQEAHKMVALFAGKAPHPNALVPGGVTCGVDLQEIERFRNKLRKVKRFIDNAYMPDLIQIARHFPEYQTLGRGVGRFLTVGAFEDGYDSWLPSGVLNEKGLQKLDLSEIEEEISYSYYDARSSSPATGHLTPQPDKKQAYSWIKAPRYAGQTIEVGPLARLLVAKETGHSAGDVFVTAAREAGIPESKLVSTLGRHLARAVEAHLLARQMEIWLDQIDHKQPTVAPYRLQASGAGYGLTEAPRGALSHWVSIEDYKISGYQAIVPSTWNFSPRGDQAQPGPVEAALEGTPIPSDSKGLEAARIVRSFDPCIACAIH